MPFEIQILSHSAEETRRIAKRFATLLHAGDAVALYGDLGSGKTVFVQGICDGLGFQSIATSPTFTIAHEYATLPPVVHVDCFRLTKTQEVQSVGLEAYFDGKWVIIVEWAEYIASYFNRWLCRIEFKFLDNEDNCRIIRFLLSENEITTIDFLELQEKLKEYQRIPVGADV